MRIKLTAMLAMAIFMPLVWVLALSTASTPMVATFGVWKCVGYAAAISVFSAWLLVGFAVEMRQYLDLQ